MAYNLKVKTKKSPNLKIKVMPRFPARVLEGPGITIVKSGGSYTFSVDADAISALIGLEIGVDVQAFDADLSALAANSTAGIWTITGAGTGAARTITGTANEITVTNGNGVSGNPTIALPAALTFAGKTITGGTFVSFDATDIITATSVDAGAGFGPWISLVRNSPSPAANDVIGAVFFVGQNTTPASLNYASIQAIILDATPASEDGELAFRTKVAGGSLADRLIVGQGVRIGAPVGGDQGVGTLHTSAKITVNANTATAVAPSVGALFQLVGADAVEAGGSFDAFGFPGRLSLRRADGTQASKSALATGVVVGAISAYGWDGSAYAQGANFQFMSSEAWTGSAHGTFWRVLTTATGSTTIVEALRAQPSGGLSVGTTQDPGTGGLQLLASWASSIPVTKTGTSGSQAATDSSLIINASGAFTLTFLAAATYPGRWLTIKTVAAFAVASASSNVVPIAGGAAGTAILAGVAGRWATLQSDGTNWIVMATG